MQLTEHFSLEELTITNTGLPNEPPLELIINGRKVADMLEDARAIISTAIGKEVSFYVSSSYRSKAVNDRVSVSPHSAHLHFLAADIIPNPRLCNLRQAFDILRKHPTFMRDIDQMVIERGCLHLGLPVPEHKYVPRRELRLDVTINGQRKYPLWAIWPAEGK